MQSEAVCNRNYAPLTSPKPVKDFFGLDRIRLCGYCFNMKTMARIFKALADETRLRILALLLDGELCVCDLMAVLQLPQSTVSRHLAYLKNSGWVDDRREGVWMFYSIRDDGGLLQASLIPVLKERLAASAAAAEDQQRLAGLSRNNCCA